MKNITKNNIINIFIPFNFHQFQINYSVKIPFLIILSKILAQAISRAFLVAIDMVD
jgi:hypothetical protein